MAILRLKPAFYSSFKPIPNFPDYEINEFGQVRSFKKGKPVLLKLKKQKSGYYALHLINNNQKKDFLVHRLVAITHLTNPLNHPFVDHINGCRYDNRLENLRWIDRIGNNCNTSSHVNSSSKYVGVSWDSSREKWMVSISLKGKCLLRNRFKTEYDAVIARDKFIIDNNLLFHKLNILKR